MKFTDIGESWKNQEINMNSPKYADVQERPRAPFQNIGMTWLGKQDC